jgi:alkylation response protein AidB-like acyl-CoA dehydrogenase
MNFDLTEEQKLLQQNILESAGRMDAAMSFAEKWKYISGTGIIGLCIESKYGGAGQGAVEMLLALESLGRANTDNGLSFAIAAHTLACVIPISKFGTEGQKMQLLPQLIDGSLIAANAMTESESGSDVFSMNTKAVRKDGRYELNGTKTFISNSHDADLVLTYAVTDADKGFFGGITAFIAVKDEFETGTRFTKMGLESCALGEILFNESLLEETSVLGRPGGGALIFNQSMEWERVCMTGLHLGAMERVLGKTLDFSKSRKTHGEPISKLQSVSHAIADMQVLLEVSRAYAYKAAFLLDKHKNAGRESSIAKLFVSESLKTFMLTAMQIFGGYGYISDYGIEKEVRDALAATIYSGTSGVQKNIIAAGTGIF